jgi:hypothetical protein
MGHVFAFVLGSLFILGIEGLYFWWICRGA